MSAFNYFDKIYCINLPEDKERKEQMTINFEKINILDRVDWISAPRPYSDYKSTNYWFAGEFGVVRSQLKALIDGLEYGISNGIVIFEDDVRFIDDAEKVLEKSLNSLPDDWSVFYLGGTPKEMMTRINKNICKVKKFTSAFAYCISKNALKEYIDFFIDRMGCKFPDACCDNILNDFILMKNKNGYACDVPIAWDIPGWSTLRQGDRNYSEGIKKSWINYTPE